MKIRLELKYVKLLECKKNIWEFCSVALENYKY